MKKSVFYKYSTALLLSSAVFYSCEDLLKEKPESFLTRESFYKNASDAVAAVNAVYAGLRDGNYYGNTVWELNEINTDQGRLLSTNGDNELREIENQIFTSTNSRFSRWWSSIYVNINRANAAIENIPNVPQNQIDATLRARLVGEAKFLRALFYFDLVRAYGDVPLYDKATVNQSELYKPRESAEKVYELILADLQEAEAALPATYPASEMGRATKGAARALLAKVHLTRREWTKAASKAREVMDLQVYSLFRDYADVFKTAHENGPEHIFSVQFRCNEGGSSYTAQFTPLYVRLPLPGTVAGTGTFEVDPAFYRGMPDHYRKQVSMDSTYTDYRTNKTVGFYPVARKYLDPGLCGQFNSEVNWIILRYADVLLMYAEALNEANGPTPEAYNAINEVRRRARGVGTPNAQPESVLPDLKDLSQEEFRQAVAQERSWELAFEGHRRWDLLRTGKYIEVMKANGKNATTSNLLFPIPQNELIINPNLTPNP